MPQNSSSKFAANVPALSAAAIGLCVASIGLALGIRAAYGTGQVAGVRIGSPLGLESAFAAGLLLVVLVRSFGERNGPVQVEEAQRGQARKVALAPLACTLLIVAAAFAFNLHDPFLSDDYILVSRAIAHPSEAFRTFWAPGGDVVYRPIGYLYFSLVQTWAHADPFRWHLCSLALHLVNCGLLYAITGSLWTNRTLPPAAALLFGLNGTRPEVVVWTAASFDLLACCFTLAATACAMRRPAGSRSPRDVAALVFLALAILSKESAYAAPVVAAGFAVAAGRWDLFRAKLLSFGAPLLCMVLFAYRWWLFGGPGGYINAATGKPQILSLSPLLAAKALALRIWAILCFPVNWEATPRSLLLALAVPALCACLGFLVYAAPALRPRVAGSLLAMTACSALPAIHLCLVGQSALGSRVFYLPSIGLCVLLAYWCISLKDMRQRVAVLILLSACWAVILAHNLNGRHHVALLAESSCTAAAGAPAAQSLSQPPGQVNGVYFFSNGFPECVSMKRSRWGLGQPDSSQPRVPDRTPSSCPPAVRKRPHGPLEILLIHAVV